MFVPPWKSQKVNGIEDLEMVQSHLKQLGLKDPWLRDEVWRYKTNDLRFRTFLWHPRYIALGIGLAAAAVYYDKLYDRSHQCPPFHVE